MRRTLFGAIRAARRFIYMQDQYLGQIADAAAELRAALPRIQHRPTAYRRHSSITEMPQVWQRRRLFIEHLLSSPHAKKVRVFFLIDPATGRMHDSYVHAKSWVIDDESAAIIGSANCNRRGYESDSEGDRRDRRSTRHLWRDPQFCPGSSG